MKWNIVFKCLVLLASSTSSVLFAEIAAKAPEVSEWVDSLKDDDLYKIVAPSSLVVIDSFSGGDANEGHPTFKNYPFKSCRNVSFFNCASSKNASYSALLNKGTLAGLKGVFALTGTNTAVVKNGETFDLVGAGPQQRATLSLTAAEFRKLDVRVLVDKVLTAVGYDGVVLAVKGDFVLVGSTEARLKRPNTQGLVMADSANHWTLTDKAQKGAGLLTLVDRSAGFGVFQLVLQGENSGQSVPIGTKIIMESK